MRLWFAAALVMLPGFAAADGVLPQALAGYRAACLASVPTFAGYRERALAAGFQMTKGTLRLPDSSARVEVFATEQGCACLTTMIAPDPDATAHAALQASLDARPDQVLDGPTPQIAAVLVWHDGSNALQVETDEQGQVPLVKTYLLSHLPCPQN